MHFVRIAFGILLWGSFVSSQTCQVPLDVLFLFDASASMSTPLHNYTALMSDIMRQFYDSRNVRIGVAAFGGQPAIVLPLIPKLRVSN
jgi:hypothetical protein